MDILNILFVVFVWTMTLKDGWNHYRKLEKKKWATLRKDLRKPYTIFGLLPFTLGYLLFLTGSRAGLGIRGLRIVGLCLFFFGGTVILLLNLKSGKKIPLKCIAMILLGASILIASIFL